MSPTYNANLLFYTSQFSGSAFFETHSLKSSDWLLLLSFSGADGRGGLPGARVVVSGRGRRWHAD